MKFIKMIRGNAILNLLKHPNEFLLLSLIALRARRTDDVDFTGLKVGQAMIGDYKNCGLTEQRYRSAKTNVQAWGLATFKGTSKGTIATLMNSDIFDINIGKTQRTKQRANNDPANGQITDGQRLTKNVKNVKNLEGTFPKWLNKKLWAEFILHRKQMKSPMSDMAEKKNLTELKKLMDGGGNQEEIINQSIANGWKGLFQTKGRKLDKSYKAIRNDGKDDLNVFLLNDGANIYKTQGIDALKSFAAKKGLSDNDIKSITG